MARINIRTTTNVCHRLRIDIDTILLFDFQRFLQTPPKYQDNIRTLLRKTLKEANDESTLKGVSRIDVEIKRGVKFLQISADLRQLQKRQEVKFIHEQFEKRHYVIDLANSKANSTTCEITSSTKTIGRSKLWSTCDLPL